MIETAENLAPRVRHQPRRSRTNGRCARTRARSPRSRTACFDDETIPVDGPGGARASRVVVTRDEHPRPGTTVEALARLKPIFARLDPDATVTAGNSSGQNDAAAVAIVTTPHEGRRSSDCVPSPGSSAGRSPASSRAHGHRSGARRPSVRWNGRPRLVRHRPDRTQRGVRRPGAGVLPRLGVHRCAISSESTSTARASPSATPSARPAGGSWPTSCARWTDARRGTAWRPCASAAVRASPPSSSE